jgi:Na+-translocating ferredoxin:NAD+ oxidoreductase RnfC subunit
MTTATSAKEALRLSGTVGAGGAGFPTCMKMAGGIDTVLVNAAECEPLLKTDYEILRQHLDDVCLGAKLFAQSMEASACLLCLKESNAQRLGLRQGMEIVEGVKAQLVCDTYPVGDELILLYEALGRVVPPGQLPSSVGAVVVNAETALNIHSALENDSPVTEKWLTVGGAVKAPCVVKVPVGTLVQDLFRFLGFDVPEGHVLVDGGPAMGKIVDYRTAAVLKTTKGLIALPETNPSAALKKSDATRLLRRASSACCQCTFCTDQCPRNLLGYPVSPHLAIRSAFTLGKSFPQAILGASLCSGCNLCSLVACCQGVAPSAVMDQMKKELSKSKAYCGFKASTPSSFRRHRMIPSSRFARLAGVSQYISETPFKDLPETAVKEVRLALSQHIGKPSIPVVSAGERVYAKQLIAEPAQGLSAALHASIGGIVASVDSQSMHIKKASG